MTAAGGQRSGEPPPAEPPSPEGRFAELLTRSVTEILDELAPGRAAVRISPYTSAPYSGVRLEVVPRNPRAAPVEVTFDDVDVRVVVGAQDCGCHLPTEEALRPAAFTFLQAVLRSAVLGRYRETAAPCGRWLRRVEGDAGEVGRGPALRASRLWIYGRPRTVSFEPY